MAGDVEPAATALRPKAARTVSVRLPCRHEDTTAGRLVEALPSGGAARASLGVASSLADLRRFAAFAAE